jgi:hypothetical protein
MAYMNLQVIPWAVIGPALLGLAVWWGGRRWPVIAGLLGIVVAIGASFLGASSFMSGDHRSAYQGLPPLHLFIPMTIGLCLVLGYFCGLLKRKPS